ncbi:MAG: hypothetical protein CL596_07745 [Alteromonas sp.]|nr:hypothetical protein [Alteromonas sp.]
MSAETILYIVIAATLAFALAVFAYGYKTKLSKPLRWGLGILRFLTLFMVFLLLINPKIKNTTYTVEKPKLPVLIDASSSMEAMEENTSVASLLATLQEDEDLNAKFEVSYFRFGETFQKLDSLSFTEKQTQIASALAATEEIFKNNVAPTILITDGNQTFGKDYEFSSRNFSNAIYPVMVGDSTQYVDLRIEQLNTNKYSFLKNEFPVEAILVYQGEAPVNTRFVIRQGAAEVYSQPLTFSNNQNSQTISFTLPSQSVGLQRYQAVLEPLSEEKNTSNNEKAFAVEVIDQATKVLIVSEWVHPDLGALKKSIESNEQRSVTIKKPLEAVSLLNDYQLVLLFQPTQSFSSVIQEIEKLKKNTVFLTGLQTDWNFLNKAQTIFSKEYSNASEEVSGNLNLNYGSYAVGDIDFSEYPPLQTSFGEVSINTPHEVLLHQEINGFDTGSPMLATIELNGKRDAIWDGEGIWKWRAQSYLTNESFQDFDDFVGRIVQYMASNKRRSRLEVSNETFYYNHRAVLISAQYFDKNFVFDSRAQLQITVKNQETEAITTFPMLLKDHFYQVDVSSLPEGDYDFTISVVGESVARSGSFTILDYNVEQQFLNTNVTKLKRVATNTNGKAYFLGQTDALMNRLLEDESYRAIQKSQQKIVPLIDWKYLLAFIALWLSAEWFIRKYNGLI